MYRRAISADPTDARTLRNYADFLWTIRNDRDRAEEMYRKAIDAASDRG